MESAQQNTHDGNNKTRPLLGVLGGMGPAATAYFYDLLVDMTDASCDQDHLDTLIYSDASIPDRTAYIVGESTESPGPVLAADAHMLESCGCSIIAIPCNTSHYFLKDVTDAVSIPVLNIIELAVAGCKRQGAKHIGVLCTDGTRKTGLYEIACQKQGLTCFYPDQSLQEISERIIYDYVKAGKTAPDDLMDKLLEALFSDHCDAVIMGCTELSIAWRDYHGSWSSALVVDSLTELVKASLLTCGKKIKEPQA